jgi:hypothetical protein
MMKQLAILTLLILCASNIESATYCRVSHPLQSDSEPDLLFYTKRQESKIPTLQLSSLPYRHQRLISFQESPGDSLPSSDTTSDTNVTSSQTLGWQPKEGKEQYPKFSYFDSLVTYFTSERLNQRSQLDRSFYHDAGDYFRFDPSYFILEHQVTPMRKTVQPFGLSGDRLNLIVNGHQLQPFEHIPEPDGLADLNDIPTALDQSIFIIPGPAGRLFGGRSGVATLLTLPKRPSEYSSESALLADKGSFGYSYVRGRYSKLFTNRREVDMSIEYRDADGPALGRKDDAYNYFGDFYFPLNPSIGFRAWGQLYNRDGDFAVWPDSDGTTLTRERFDRSAKLSFDFHNHNHTARTELGYQHLRQGSYLSGVYKTRLNLTGHGGFLTREWISGQTIFQARLDGNYSEYDDGFKNLNRTNSVLSLNLARLNDGYRWAFSIESEYVEDFGFLPSGVAVLFRESPQFFLMFGAGYSERAPSLLELHLPFQISSIYRSARKKYADQGNSELKKEKQLTGNVTLELGSPDNNIGISVTGGNILDGIDWQNQSVTDSVGTYILFSPSNGDVAFVDVSIQPKLRLRNFLHLLGGGAYHYLDYKEFTAKAYSPAYQIFSGMELHVYWSQKLLDLFAYGEIVYTGPYDGYDKKGLGKELVANAKLSLGLKDFRFHFVFQNVLSNVYRAREYITFPGRYFYYGLTWSFLN